MLHIFVLEDSPMQQMRLETVLREILAEQGWSDVTIFITGKPDQLLAAVAEKGSHNLFLLDIEIHGEEQKGLELAQIIRKGDAAAQIAFITTHSEFMPLSFQYKVGAIDFIAKDEDQRIYKANLLSVLTYVRESLPLAPSEDYFLVETPQSRMQIPFEELLVVETVGRSHRLLLHTINETFYFTGTISQVQEQESRLFLAHRSMLVNPKNIQRIDKKDKQVYFVNGLTRSISRRKLADLLEVWKTE